MKRQQSKEPRTTGEMDAEPVTVHMIKTIRSRRGICGARLNANYRPFDTERPPRPWIMCPLCELLLQEAADAHGMTLETYVHEFYRWPK